MNVHIFTQCTEYTVRNNIMQFMLSVQAQFTREGGH